jgi:hypothetical protein
MLWSKVIIVEVKICGTNLILGGKTSKAALLLGVQHQYNIYQKFHLVHVAAFL